METKTVSVDRGEARRLYRAYKKHRYYSEPIDRECMRAYQLLAQGQLIIKALESVRAAGLNARGLPKLALCRADATACNVAISRDGSGIMSAEGAMRYWSPNRDTSKVFNFAAGAFLSVWRAEGTGLVPGIPLHLRPQRGLANYHILWEAEWVKRPPQDPYLLRRIGKADLWLVVAAWDLTEVERAALETRMR